MSKLPNKIITECVKCGSKEFYIIESIIHNGDILEDEPSVLYASNAQAKIEEIRCKKCAKLYDEHNFKTVNF